MRIAYLSFDSVREGVGVSQVLPYVHRLAARGVAIDLHTFECGTPAPADRLAVERPNLRWTPHAFGRGGSFGGATRVLRGAVAVRGADLVHARADLAAFSALLARRPFVWDMRSFWLDQRVESGAVRYSSMTARVLRSMHRAVAARAEAVVVLAGRAIDALRDVHGPHTPSLARVIATCTDLDVFRPTPLPEGTVVLHAMGSLNRLYDFGLLAAFATAARREYPAELRVLRTGRDERDSLLVAAGASLHAVDHAEVPAHLSACHAGLVFLRGDLGRSAAAAVPTKIGEYLASGRPVVVTPGMGDMDAIIDRHRCGIVVRSGAPEELSRAALALRELLEDPALVDRCREAAGAHFDVERAADQLVELYQTIARVPRSVPG